MKTLDHTIRIRSPEHYGGQVPPALVAPVLQKLGSLARKSLRMNVSGRSSGGRAPRWLDRACDIRFVNIGSDGDDTLLGFTAPVLSEAIADEFNQEAFPFFERPDPNGSALNVASLMLDDVAKRNSDSLRFDSALLKEVGGLSKTLNIVSDVWIEGGAQGRGRHGHLTAESCRIAKGWIDTAPEPRTVRVTGTMDMMRVSRSSFALALKNNTEVRGVLKQGKLKDYGAVLGQSVMVTGQLVYRPSGAPLRIDADNIELSDDTNPLWLTLPAGRSRQAPARSFRQLQRPGEGLGAFFGSLKDDGEDEDAIQAALDELS